MGATIHCDMRYRAFISYSHRDKAVAAWVQGALERYHVPSKLVGRETAVGIVPARLHPLFRDRDELPASGDLGTELKAALRQSMFLILICSPASAKSRWVNEEVLNFKRMHGEGRVLALICDGEPGDPERECFPKALQYLIGPDGELSDKLAEPIAADIRKHADGKRLAKFKLIAGLTGLRLDDLIQREAARRARRLTLIATAATIGMVGALALAFYANQQRQVAEHQRQLADKSVEFLTGTFAIANPAKENPRTITVLSILDRASKRAAEELRNEPEVAARLLQTTGEIYINLGLPQESERDLRKALALSPAMGETRARILLGLANGAYGRSDAKAALALVDSAEAAIEPSADYAPELLAEATYWRAMTQFLDGDYAKSVVELNAALALFEALPGDHRKEMGRVWMRKGIALSNLRNFVEADAAFAKAEALYTAKFGKNHLLTAFTLQSRALGALGNNQIDIALAKVTEALAIYDRILDPDHPTVGTSKLLLGRIQ
ncbi:toll/interleukin-1 receptor domain-containing protein, partial [Pseudanabaena biceps]|nr:toll/interleukin-1 receptor domain-containing protein [Pseudanabaena biceps]